jgi:radical SAM superfamily enzyme YgiQ (UPF0313 family)
MKKAIYLIDISHESSLGLGSDSMPLQIGLIAAYCLKMHGDKVDIQLFKFLDDLINAVENQPPFIVGASNYVWNTDLSYQVVSAIKERFPQTVIVLGGPNYPEDFNEQVEWLTQHPIVDFYIFRDGELPFSRLVGYLLDGADVVTIQQAKLPSCHALIEGKPFFGDLEPRLQNLEEIPSPYILRLMDNFFEQNLLPMIRTNRGCPFNCTFCAEGHEYYDRIYKTSFERKKEEVDYIVDRVKYTKTLRLADSNFGMFREDVEFCQYLSEIQERTGYPEYLNCASGKNRKDLVLKCNELVRGAMRLTASVQSLNKDVLENVKRRNISISEMISISDQTSDTNTHIYSEIILALPGDSLEAQKESMSGLINIGIGNITQHQLSIVPGTEIASCASRELFGMKSMFRPIQRCFGQYNFFDKKIISIEIEEICVENNTLSFDEYIEARRLYLTIGLFYNDRIFGEIHALLRILQLPTWEWLIRIHNNLDTAPMEIKTIYDDFSRDTVKELYSDPEKLLENVTPAIDDYISGKTGGNLIYKYRSKAIVQHFHQLHETAFRHLRGYFNEKNLILEEVLSDIEKFSQRQKEDIFNTNIEAVDDYYIDIIRLIKEPEIARQGKPLIELCVPTRIRLKHTSIQKQAIQREMEFYGRDVAGLTLLLSRFPLKRCYRTAEYESKDLNE